MLCIKRSEINSFLPNYTVFPGGTTDKSDSSPEWTNIIPDYMNSNLNLNIIGYNGNIEYPINLEHSQNLYIYILLFFFF